MSVKVYAGGKSRPHEYASANRIHVSADGHLHVVQSPDGLTVAIYPPGKWDRTALGDSETPSPGPEALPVAG